VPTLKSTLDCLNSLRVVSPGVQRRISTRKDPVTRTESLVRTRLPPRAAADSVYAEFAGKKASSLPFSVKITLLQKYVYYFFSKNSNSLLRLSKLAGDSHCLIPCLSFLVIRRAHRFSVVRYLLRSILFCVVPYSESNQLVCPFYQNNKNSPCRPLPWFYPGPMGDP
jgi:hypothetical protein